MNAGKFIVIIMLISLARCKKEPSINQFVNCINARNIECLHSMVSPMDTGQARNKLIKNIDESFALAIKGERIKSDQVKLVEEFEIFGTNVRFYKFQVLIFDSLNANRIGWIDVHFSNFEKFINEISCFDIRQQKQIIQEIDKSAVPNVKFNSADSLILLNKLKDFYTKDTIK